MLRSTKGRARRAYYTPAFTLDSGLRSFALEQEQIIQTVCNGLGITLFNLTKDIAFSPEELTAESIAETVYERYREEVRHSDIVILDGTHPDFWTGQVSEIAGNLNIPVVLLAYAGAPISRTIRGSRALNYQVHFLSKADLKADLPGVLRLAFTTAELQTESGATSPSGIVDVVSTINAELVDYLRSHPEGLYALHPRQFEELIAELLVSFGWKVELTPKIKDGGYDIFAISNSLAPGISGAWIIECKRYKRENKVGVEIVRALYGAKSTFEGINVMLATTSSFTEGARRFKASRYNLELRDYNGVMEWLQSYSRNPNGTLYIASESAESDNIILQQKS